MISPVLTHHLPTMNTHLAGWMDAGQLPGAMLLSFPKGSGETEATQYLTSFMLCEHATKLNIETDQDSLFGGGSEPLVPIVSPALTPCAKCYQCTTIASGQNVDMTVIRAESEDASRSGTLKIEDLEPIRASMGFRPHQARFRVFVILGAETLTPTAANSLLKILEEPPSSWKFILTTSDASLILPTIVSRCQRMRFKPLTSSIINSALHAQDISLERRQLTSKLSQGNLDRALFLTGEEIWKKRALLGQFLSKPESVLNDLIEWAAKDHTSFSALIDQWEFLIWDLSMKLSLVHHEFENSDLKSSLELWLNKSLKQNPNRNYWLSKIQIALDSTAQVRQRMQAPLNKKLLAQEMLIPWLSVLN
ncbi:MAG: hypothetical protein KA715_12110 [Xanthomonadaceae bacterium]|nr:hypothetical protein [Xanthomonadaceae bacterium]